MTEDERSNILVIKLGALGDFVQALGPMAAIRKHHPQSSITLLTTAPFELLARTSGYFNDVRLDKRPKWHDWRGWADLRNFFNEGNFSRVYDLQNNDRTAFYLKLFSSKPEWVGAARGASHRNASAKRTEGRAFDGHVQTLALAGIRNITPDTLSWLMPDHDVRELPKPYVLIVPGASPKHPEKKWPAAHFAQICKSLLDKGLTPVVLGGQPEKDIGAEIENAAHGVLNLCSQTSLFDIPALARGAAGAIGNDTGPMHLIAQSGCPSIVLFASSSNPKRHAPIGRSVVTLQKSNLEELSPQDVWRAFGAQMSPS